jgi:hypothetical protein
MFFLYCSEACELYDQLAPLCPIMLALTAASPAQRGYLVDSDCRWNIISAAVDDRHDRLFLRRVVEPEPQEPELSALAKPEQECILVPEPDLNPDPT